METVNIRNDVSFEKKVLLCIYWTARKTVNTEGCAPFYIQKIITPCNNYTRKDRKILKLSSNIISEIQEDSGHFEPTKIEIQIGGENLNAHFENETFSISAEKNKELELEIVDKLGTELKKKHPSTCPQFISRVYKH
ncbi:hypothetical protein [Methanobacterium oryzae]|uniref:hypothetical protein n=1 Tax=Methanobacterium oryzae TaxID=69540 RepID=UPI003D19C029